VWAPPPDLPHPRVRVGVDLVAVERLARLVTDNPGGVETLFTARERAYCDGKRRRFEHLAARFAAKEAVLKALGTGISGGIELTDVEVVRERSGRPRVVLHGAARAAADRARLRQLDVSLSHSGGFALAHAIAVFQRG
jgi:holo-[acyl-carrier protein] synthase